MAKELVSLHFLPPQFHIPLRPKPPQNPIFPRRHRNRTSSNDAGVPSNEVKTIAKFKSRHNYIRVIEVSRRSDHPLAGSRLLLLDTPGNIHSISFLLKTLTDSYFDVFATLPPIIPPGPIGVLGFGAGSTARLILELYPPEYTVHGWEIDPSVIDVGREFFSLSKLEREHKDRIFINVGDALNASVRAGFSGILVDLFSEGSVVKELQDPNVWRELKSRLRKRGRIMVSVGGRCVKAEDSERDGDLVMVETLKAMSQVFGDNKLFVLTLGSGDDSSVALTGDLPDLDAWKKRLPVRELRSYVDMWKPFAGFTLS
ncbi:S-adenosyl-L-methionine-dependent methyltransferases superfamily protein [Hirschfeldia incana]|nr:S-adenosyl-L-methionine-dependent methyltransferases superfamily protein [Hirschfeldia incana]